MDNAHNAGPQIRSRITVVCAECKRLKLRCDRRNPCGSCTKRDTVARCQYSPAAVDKVDLHSLNNRLLQVESTLALITAGQTPPAFQPTYPFSFTPGGPPATPAAHTAHHHHHHHYAVTPSSSQSLALSDRELASIWLDDLVPQGLYLKGKHRIRDQQRPVDGVKLEPSIHDVDLVGDAHDSGNGDSASIFARPTSQHRSSDPRHPSYLPLPPLSIYYPTSIPTPGPSSHPENPYPTHNPSTSGSASAPRTFTRDSSKPQITPALLSLLPPPDRCRDLLTRAKHHFRLRPVPFLPSCFFPSPDQVKKRRIPATGESTTGTTEVDESELEDEETWRLFEKRCWALLGVEGRNKEKEKERERIKEEKRRAREIYFAGYNHQQQQQDGSGVASVGPGTPTGTLIPSFASPYNQPPLDPNVAGTPGRPPPSAAPPPTDSPAKQDESLAFFALLAAVLAVGSINAPTPSSPTTPTAQPESGEFLYALSQQAIGVWDTHVSTAPPPAPSIPSSSTTSSNAVPSSTHTPSFSAPFIPSISSSSTTWTAKERDDLDKMENLLACLVGVVYVLSARRESLRASMSTLGAEAGHSDNSTSTLDGEGREHAGVNDLGEWEEAKRRERERISAIIAKLVNAARNMGLGKDTPSRSGASGGFAARAKTKGTATKDGVQGLGMGSANSGGVNGPVATALTTGGIKDTAAAARKEAKEHREERKEEWRRIVWWDVLFYDLFVADALDQQPLLPSYSYSVRSLPTFPTPTTSATMQPPSLLGSSTSTATHGLVVNGRQVEDEGVQDHSLQNSDASNGHGDTRLEDGFGLDAAPASTATNDDSSSKLRRPGLPLGKSRKAYLIARCRLTSLAQRILHALSHPSCCCGYTIDQALSLEGELRAWLTALPDGLKFDAASAEVTPAPTSIPSTVSLRASPSPDSIRRREVWKLHAAELNVLFNLLTLKIWCPFLARPSSSAPPATGSAPGSVASGANGTGTAMATTMNNHASVAVIQAASGIMKGIKALTSPLSSKPSPTVTTFSFFTSSKLLWDSLVICSSALISPPSPSSSFLSDGNSGNGPTKAKDLTADLRAGLDILVSLVKQEDTRTVTGSLKDSERAVADVIYKMVVMGYRPAGVGKWSNGTSGVAGDAARRDRSQSVSEGKGGVKRKHDQVEGGPATPIRSGPGPSFPHVNDESGVLEYVPDFGDAHHQSQRPSHQPHQNDHSGHFSTPDQGYQQHASDAISGDQPQTAAVGFAPHGPSAASRSSPSSGPSSSLGYSEYASNTTATVSHVATASSSVPQTPQTAAGNPYPPHQQQQQQQQPDLVAAIQTTVRAKRAVGSSSGKDKGDKDKDKDKERRRKSPVYPSIGVRIRIDKDGHVARPRSGTHAQSATSTTKGNAQAPGPLMTYTPRPHPPAMNATAERVMQFQQQHKKTSTPPESHGDQQQHDPYRQRSSSLSYGLGPMPTQAPPPPPQRQPPPSTQHPPTSSPEVEYSGYSMLDMENPHHHLDAGEQQPQQHQQHQHAYHSSAHPLSYDQSQGASMYQPSPQQASFELSQEQLIDELQDAARRRFSNPSAVPPNSATSYSNPPFSNTMASPFSTSSGGSPFATSGNTMLSNATPPGHAYSTSSHMTAPVFGPHPPPSSSHAAPQPTPTPQLPSATNNANDASSSNSSESPTGYFHELGHASGYTGAAAGGASAYANPGVGHGQMQSHPSLHPQSHHNQELDVAMLESQNSMSMEVADTMPQTPIYDKGGYQRPPGGMHHHGHHQGAQTHSHQPPPTPGSLYGHNQQLHVDGGGGANFDPQPEQLDMMMGVAGASVGGGWSQSGGMPQQQQHHIHSHQPLPSPHQPRPTQPPLWNNGTDFKFFS